MDFGAKMLGLANGWAVGFRGKPAVDTVACLGAGVTEDSDHLIRFTVAPNATTCSSSAELLGLFFDVLVAAAFKDDETSPLMVAGWTGAAVITVCPASSLDDEDAVGCVWSVAGSSWLAISPRSEAGSSSALALSLLPLGFFVLFLFVCFVDDSCSVFTVTSVYSATGSSVDILVCFWLMCTLVLVTGHGERHIYKRQAIIVNTSLDVCRQKSGAFARSSWRV